MSQAQPIRPRMAGKASSAFAIIASQYNHDYVQGLVTHAHNELQELEPGSSTKLFWTPGAFEIPLIAKIVAASKRYNAVIALGVVLQGETAHASLIGQSVTNSLQEIALTAEVPVIHAVLLLDNEEQARARCLEDPINRGTEAARAAVASARLIREIGINK